MVLPGLIPSLGASTRRCRTPRLSPFASHWDKDTTPALEKAGVVFGEPVNKLFRNAILPDGWKIQNTDHYLYSNLCDEKGRVRAQIMYHVQDQDAWISGRRRFDPAALKDDWEDREAPYIPVIRDSNGNQLWRGLPTTGNSTDRDVAQLMAEQKLNKLASNWKQLDAYWDEEGDKIVFPPHETPIDTRKQYTLWVDLYRDNSHVDSGNHHSVKAINDNEAETKLKEALDGLSHYTVRWVIRCGDRVVSQGRVEREPPPPPRWMGMDGRIYDGYDRYDYRDYR